MSPDEVNNFYRGNDIKRWQDTEFVLGYEVRLSSTPKLQLEICKELAGVYPKWFVFTGWSKGCGCYIVPIMPSMIEFKEYQKYLLKGRKDYIHKGIVKDVPLNLKKWVFQNQDISPIPRFVKDNFIDGDIKLGLNSPYKERLLVQLQCLPYLSSTDEENNQLNDTAYSHIEIIEDVIKGMECKQHPTITSTLIVTPTKEKNLQFNENFCCEAFWYKVMEKLKTVY